MEFIDFWLNNDVFSHFLHDVCPKNLFSTGGQAAHAVKTSEETAYEPFQRLNSVGRKFYLGFVAGRFFSEFSLFYSKVSTAGNSERCFYIARSLPACTQEFYSAYIF
ncbi:hypothetical protein [Treponema sp. R80B11-R83G3]